MYTISAADARRAMWHMYALAVIAFSRPLVLALFFGDGPGDINLVCVLWFLSMALAAAALTHFSMGILERYKNSEQHVVTALRYDYRSGALCGVLAQPQNTAPPTYDSAYGQFHADLRPALAIIGLRINDGQQRKSSWCDPD